MNVILVFFLIFVVLIIFLLFLYFYRKKLNPTKYKDTEDLNLFLKDLNLYMKHHHPKIDINYNILEKIKTEHNVKIKKSLIIEDVVNQFINYSYAKKTKQGLPREKYWTNYLEKSLSNPKYPNDWLLRREFVWRRENKCCDRCGKNLELNEVYTLFIKEIASGGQYNLENIVCLCIDCNKILNSKKENPYLLLNDKLLTLIN